MRIGLRHLGALAGAAGVTTLMLSACMNDFDKFEDSGLVPPVADAAPDVTDGSSTADVVTADATPDATCDATPESCTSTRTTCRSACDQTEDTCEEGCTGNGSQQFQCRLRCRTERDTCRNACNETCRTCAGACPTNGCR